MPSGHANITPASLPTRLENYHYINPKMLPTWSQNDPPIEPDGSNMGSILSSWAEPKWPTEGPESQRGRKRYEKGTQKPRTNNPK